MQKATEYPTILFTDARAWADWLETHHASVDGVWVRLAKKDANLTSVSRDEALDLALCYGWIDGQGKRLDSESWLQKFTPRRKRSLWSKRNRQHVERLIASGMMRPAGFAAIEAAKEDGRWDRAYDSAATATVPDDLEAAFADAPEAKEFFESLKGANRYAILVRIQTAVKPETRARRIAKFVEMLGRRETIYP